MWAISYRCHVRDSQGHGSGLRAALRPYNQFSMSVNAVT